MALTTTLPTLYQHYTTGGITNGLSIDQPHFTLNNKNFSIYSGAMHYFRIPKQYWRDRLRKLRAAGLNTVETYVPWNLHEPQNGTYDFGNGGTDMQDFLDVGEFLKLAKEEDLFAIVRPGPYICAEWEFGGLPSWLLRDENIKLRTSETKYMSYVRRYFSLLLPILAAFQFLNGGPVIAFQVENEYASTPYGTDKEYLRQLYEMYREYGIKELLLSSDNDYMAQAGTIPQLLFQTINFGATPAEKLKQLAEIQPGKPLMVMEYWDGWYDHWSESHHTVSSQQFHDDYETILKYPASVNVYLFHGGTNFGFLNGANIDNDGNYLPTITSYDYNAVLTEAGDYTEKYQHLKNLLEKYNTIKLRTPDVPELVPRVVYPTTKIDSIIPYERILEQANEIVSSRHPIPMELLPINNNSGQSYGYTVYRKENIDIEANTTLTISGYLYDSVIVLINNQIITKPLSSNTDLDNFGYWRLKDSSIILTNQTIRNATIDLLVENWGRINYGEKRYQYKGLQDSVLLNGNEINDWKIIPLEFKRKWNENINGWQTRFNYQGPALYRAQFTIDNDDQLKDTYVDMEEWVKGLVIINGFPLGRYVKLGPQQSLYLPAPFLRVGVNEMVIFEQFQAPQNIKFTTDLIFKTA